MSVVVRWPDGREQDCYSPSLVMHDHLVEGGSYAVADFVRRATHALEIASDRVKAKYGFACTSAAATTEQIARAATAYSPGQLVEVVRMWPPMPPEERS
ncbi:MSMEG_0570 family nitrogen starvation response protein [Nocardioides plantarum]|uniref:MSMEG_0570 family nitrogen starvation response protein n=1 Tax=Nocardioides plantarum TaxID=29299 RepID=A0ABV5K837_9ACTN|nr:MSMEG_0570 family nitrogen starvation response protein [Nocardioides plantarum]